MGVETKSLTMVWPKRIEGITTSRVSVVLTSFKGLEARYILCRWREPPEHEKEIPKARKADTITDVSTFQALCV
jgi:hypothetical protein